MRLPKYIVVGYDAYGQDISFRDSASTACRGARGRGAATHRRDSLRHRAPRSSKVKPCILAEHSPRPRAHRPCSVISSPLYAHAARCTKALVLDVLSGPYLSREAAHRVGSGLRHEAAVHLRMYRHRCTDAQRAARAPAPDPERRVGALYARNITTNAPRRGRAVCSVAQRDDHRGCVGRLGGLVGTCKVDFPQLPVRAGVPQRDRRKAYGTALSPRLRRRAYWVLERVNPRGEPWPAHAPSVPVRAPCSQDVRGLAGGERADLHSPSLHGRGVVESAGPRRPGGVQRCARRRRRAGTVHETGTARRRKATQ